ncbi:CPBP family glutamic-type intramembrane protease [Bradyrhizobium uaiense]|uniref:CPBP family intramembrane metalloprotease n=1 Tax=Bradyrhizobium uaiense TaxID=2594946 RepID=A0A6P1B863_9BRAD|nr:CPBP family intramembrane metalloprotease [Bradyrhizobium uaiense]
MLLVAVRIARESFATYCNLRRPHGAAVALAVGTFLVAEIVLRGIPYLATGSLRNNLPVEDYQAMIAPGMWPWWYVLKYWPAAIFAPLVEETAYRGFLWRGLAASRLGHGGSLLVSALFFAAVHYHYYIQGGQVVLGALISPFIFGLIFGFVRWRSGSTIAAMITHALGNIALSVLTVLAVRHGWP